MLFSVSVCSKLFVCGNTNLCSWLQCRLVNLYYLIRFLILCASSLAISVRDMSEVLCFVVCKLLTVPLLNMILVQFNNN